MRLEGDEGMYLIVGLGNPGNQYAGTRHNIGFDAVDYIASQYQIPINKVKHKAVIGQGMIQGHKVILAKPQTYMNLSGESIRDIKSWYNIALDNIVVIYDDISLPAGKIRIRGKGTAGGHNGIKSMTYQLKSENFIRIKIGVGQPEHEEYELADYVLSQFNQEEKVLMKNAVQNTADAVTMILQAGTNRAMNCFN